MSDDGAAEAKRPRIEAPNVDNVENSNHTPRTSKEDLNDGPKISTQETLEELDRVQSELDTLNEKANDEIIKIEKKYNQLRNPHYESRQKLIEAIPNFWVTVFINHPTTREILSEDEEELMHYLTRLEVTEDLHENESGYTIRFVFDVNPYFENRELVKAFSMESNGELTCTSTKIDWKPGKEPKRTTNRTNRPFFDWFKDTEEPSSDDVADIIKDEIWINPLQYFLMPDAYGDGEDDEVSSDEGNLAEDLQQ
ncbi:Protein SET [Aphelenchoides besseyi]|nr:Protein SET [Aphelenchoides besseyi]